MDLYSNNKLEPKINFQRKIEKYFTELADGIIPNVLLKEIIDMIADTQYHNYTRFWEQYPKSRKRYSELKLEDLEHPFTKYEITNFLKRQTELPEQTYRLYSKKLLQMTDEELDNYELRKHQYETK